MLRCFVEAIYQCSFERKKEKKIYFATDTTIISAVLFTIDRLVVEVVILLFIVYE